MNQQMIEAVRKEAFVHGYLAGRTDACQSQLDDSEVLELLPGADEAYVKWRAERSQ